VSRPTTKWIFDGGTGRDSAKDGADFSEGGTISTAPKVSSHVPTQVSSRSRASSRGSFNTIVESAEESAAARTSAQSGQCAASNPNSRKLLKRGGDSEADWTDSRSVS